ncbi:MAG: alanine--tRNA ligase [Fimbriimonadaceae bacterium]|nr:alanine--tRNA ligase [Fimbriimonadaceae bacterium]
METRELRRKFLEFFESKGHGTFPSGSLIPYDVTGRLDESLLFNGAGMVQFKPYFRGVAKPEQPRLTTAQKCVRTGDIEEVGDTSHLTFFEMLGNFSFGDYFKELAIAYSWEFLTSSKWLNLPPSRLSFTVFEEDEEAFDLWAAHVSAAGINPEYRIFRLGEDTNYWPAGSFSNGPPGPCGPNSEMFYWTPNDEPAPSGPYSKEEWQRDEAAGKWLEVANDVFIQYEWQGRLRNPDRPADGYIKTGMPNLPFQSIDTGMGLERTAAVISGFNSVYETDAFRAIFRVIESVGTTYGRSESEDRAIRIIADHIRTACFCIADGILPSNNGRGYVLRRLIRRAVLKGQRTLGFDVPFFHLIYEGVAETMGDHYTELLEKRDVIIETLRNEEAQFRRTISQGSEMLTIWLDTLVERGQRALDGKSAFKLYDTYGFPLEVTQEICAETGVSVDVEGYEVALKEAQDRSRAADQRDSVYGGVDGGLVILIHQIRESGPTEFVGYSHLTSQSQIVAALPETDEANRPTGNIAVALDRTPFYAESGGQVSDEGLIVGPGFELKVIDLVKQDGIYVHLCEPLSVSHPADFRTMSSDDLQQVLNEQFFQKPVRATVDAVRRQRITRHHTATHLLHASLRKRLGTHVTQAGSLVSPDHLRFDFTHGKGMTPAEIQQVEADVNEAILNADPVTIHENVPLQEAKAMGAMALFGEKYGQFVRVVDVRGDQGEPVSVELCGGCHVRSTGQIGLFKIVSESSAASGVRRIEAIAGDRAALWANKQHETLVHAAGLLKSTPQDLVRAIEKNLESLREERKTREKLMQQSVAAARDEVIMVGPVELVIKILQDVDPKEAQQVADQIAAQTKNRVGIVVVKGANEVKFIAKVGKDAVSAGANAGALVKDLATKTGGGGGGRPDFATAGGRNLEAVDQAIESLPIVLKGQVG